MGWLLLALWVIGSEEARLAGGGVVTGWGGFVGLDAKHTEQSRALRVTPVAPHSLLRTPPQDERPFCHGATARHLASFQFPIQMHHYLIYREIPLSTV